MKSVKSDIPKNIILVLVCNNREAKQAYNDAQINNILSGLERYPEGFIREILPKIAIIIEVYKQLPEKYDAESFRFVDTKISKAHLKELADSRQVIQGAAIALRSEGGNQLNAQANLTAAKEKFKTLHSKIARQSTINYQEGADNPTVRKILEQNLEGIKPIIKPLNLKPNEDGYNIVVNGQCLSIFYEKIKLTQSNETFPEGLAHRILHNEAGMFVSYATDPNQLDPNTEFQTLVYQDLGLKEEKFQTYLKLK
jgi:hypothetical protein